MSSLFKPFLFVILIFFLKVTILYPTVPQPNSVFSNCEDFVNVLDSANLVIPDIIHRALHDTHLKFKPYQDTKHREKSKVNMPRTQKVGAEKEASEPTGSPGTLAPPHTQARSALPRDQALRDIHCEQDVASVVPAQRDGGERKQSALGCGQLPRACLPCVTAVLLHCRQGRWDNLTFSTESCWNRDKPLPILSWLTELTLWLPKRSSVYIISKWFGEALKTLDFTL